MATPTHQRFSAGFRWGVVATVAMSLLMVAGMASGLSPMPRPIPLAIARTVLGEGTPLPAIMAVAVLSHLMYGGFWGGALVTVREHVTIASGLVLGVVLWLLMQVAALPLLGWGAFGSSVTPKIAAATLILHAVYGVVLGHLADRRWVESGSPDPGSPVDDAPVPGS